MLNYLFCCSHYSSFGYRSFSSGSFVVPEYFLILKDKVLQADVGQSLPGSRSAPFQSQGSILERDIKNPRQVVIAHRVSRLLGFLAAHEGNVHAARIRAQSHLPLCVFADVCVCLSTLSSSILHHYYMAYSFLWVPTSHQLLSSYLLNSSGPVCVHWDEPL